jgi:glycosyltransferase involved in cell wall biosynthesis
MHAPLVSIIMAAYNHDRYIDKAIASALAQTWKSFELIVVDDGSTDTTSQVVSRFGDSVRYIYQENRGQGGARNRGIASASGKYVCFLDDDDLWDSGYLATVTSVLEKEPETAALYTGYRMIDDEDRPLPQTGVRMVPPDRMYDALVCGGWFPPMVVTVRRDCLEQVGPLDETLRGHDDWDLWLRIARSCVFAGIPEVLASYRIHVGGLSADVAHMLEDRRRASAKHFGPEEGDPASWPTDRRRAYGAGYRDAGLAHLQADEFGQGYLYLSRAFEINPRLLDDLHTFYEWACGDQPRGCRGQVKGLDIERNGKHMLRGLDGLFAADGGPMHSMRGAAYGKAHLALAMLSDQAGDWAAARHHLLQAVLSDRALVHDRSVARRFVKLLLGQRVIASARLWQLKRAGDPPE